MITEEGTKIPEITISVQTMTCPECKGKGCDFCKGTGEIRYYHSPDVEEYIQIARAKWHLFKRRLCTT